MVYAADTIVPVDRSQMEIKKILARYGATSFVYGESEGSSMVMFEMAHRRIKIVLPMPDKSGRRYDQLCRSRWRCLVLVIKAKLESVASGITTLEQEFLAHIVLPNGSTIGQAILPQIDASYRENKMPPLLGYGP